MKVLLLALAIATPSPAPTVPIDFSAFCRDARAGRFIGLISIPGKGVVVSCRGADYLFSRDATPTKIPHTPGVDESPRP